MRERSHESGELGCVPNRAARTLVTSRTDAIALVVPEAETRLFSGPYFSDVISGVSAELAETEMQLLLILVRNQRERERLSAYLTAGRVDGVLVVPVHQDDPLPSLLESLEIPSMPAGRPGGRGGELEPLSYVHADNAVGASGARMAVRHLLRRGCRQVVTITGPLDMEVAPARLGATGRRWRRPGARTRGGARGPGRLHRGRGRQIVPAAELVVRDSA